MAATPSTRFPDVLTRNIAGIEKIGFRSDRALQSTELNDLQEIIMDAMRRMAAGQYHDGDVITGSELIIPPASTGSIQLLTGAIFFNGKVRPVDGETFTIPFNSDVSVGIRMLLSEIDEIDDADLLDPASGTTNYQEPGATRTKIEYHWGWRDDAGHADARSDWQFYPIYEVDNGVLIIKAPPAIADPYLELTAKYDREAHGSYVVGDGLKGSYIGVQSGQQVYEVTAGLADILGYKIERRTSSRLAFTPDPDTISVNNEPHTFVPDINGEYQMFTNRSPIASLGEIIVVKEKTVNVVKGSSNSTDPDAIPDPSVLAVLEVKQGGTTYQTPRDYTVVGDDINWTPSGVGAIEPAPGSTYTVHYTYQTTAAPIRQGKDYLVFKGLYNGSTITTDYTYKVPRMDLIVMDGDGNVSRIKGIPQIRNPYAPTPSPNQIALCTVLNDWVSDPVVLNIAIRAIPYNELELQRKNTEDLFQMVAILQLQQAVNVSDPSSKYGVFVDPFLDDSQRDQGIAQTAAIFGKIMQLAIDGDAHDPDNAMNFGKAHTLDFTLETLVEQANMTACMKVNPYQAFDPPPARLQMNPTVDNWTEYDDTWASTRTQNIITGDWHGQTDPKKQFTNSYTTVSTSVLSSKSSLIPFIRPRTIAYIIDGFGPGETLAQITFGGVNVPLT